ncbi:MAG: redoxin family protein [Alphaproteobacteria bacterium]|nr:redoxin family protein [Alphaproteobacteria bacterium]
MARVLALVGFALASLASVPAPALTINWDRPTPLPSLELETAAGETVGLDAFAGRVVVLNLWATWCAPCEREMPTLAALQAAFDPAAVRVVALAVDRAGFAELESFLAELGAHDLRLVRDPEGAAARALAAPGLPMTLILDAEGRERFRHAGYADWSTATVVEAVGELAGVTPARPDGASDGI